MDNLLKKTARLGNRFPKTIIASWIALLILLVSSVLSLGTKLNDDFTIDGSESITGLEILTQQLPQASGGSGQILIQAGPDITAANTKKSVTEFLDKIRTLKHVRYVADPYETKNAISESKHYALADIQVDDFSAGVQVGKEIRPLQKALAQEVPGSTVHLSNLLAKDYNVGISWVEGLGILLALIILLATLNSFVAATLPILTALIAVGFSGALIGLGTWIADISSTAPTLAVMLGLSVGIDYSLLLLSRIREHLGQGHSLQKAIEEAATTSGKSIIFAALTVIIALLGMFVVGIYFLTMMGVVSALTVFIAMLAVLTLIPAIATLLGQRLTPKTPKTAKLPHPLARKWAGVINAHPLWCVLITLLAAILLTIPASAMRLALPDAGHDRPDSEARQTYDLITREYGEGHNTTIAVIGSLISSTTPLEDARALGDAIKKYPGVKEIALATPDPKASIAFVRIIPSYGQADPRTTQLVKDLREHRAQLTAESGVQNLMVTGITAVAIDVSNQLDDALIPFGAIVVILCIILLTILFRSFWVPLIAALGYLASLGVAFGAIGAIYGWGWGATLFQIPKVGPVITFMPILVMGVLFGLAMDYQVFIVSRIREAHLQGKTTPETITEAFTGSGKVVAAAALIMTGVFAAFIPHASAEVRPIAIALTVGIAFDAFVVRMTLIPAIMRLLGKHAWAFPKRSSHRRGYTLIAASFLAPVLLGIGIWGAWVYFHPGNTPPTVALVNEDEPYDTGNGQLLPAGRMLSAQLTEPELAAKNLEKAGLTANSTQPLDNRINWQIVTLDTMKKGLENGKYDLGVVIPKNFSQTLAKTLRTEAYGAQVKIDSAPKTSGKTVLEVQNIVNSATYRIGSNLTANFLNATFSETGKLANGLKAAATGAEKLQDGINQAQNGTQKLGNGAEKLANGAGELSNGLDRLTDGAQAAANGSNELANGSKQLSGGANQLAGGINQLASSTPALRDGINQLVDGITQTSSALQNQITPGAQQLAGGLNQVTPGAKQLAQGVQKIQLGAQQLARALEQLLPGSKQLAGGLGQLQAGSAQLAGGITSSHEGAKQLTNGLGQLQQGANQLDEGLKKSHTGANQLAAGLEKSSDGADKLAQSSAQLGAGADALKPGLEQYIQSIDQLAEACKAQGENTRTCLTLGIISQRSQAGQLKENTSRILSGISQLAQGNTQLSEGLKQLVPGSKQLAGGLGQLQAGSAQLAGGITSSHEGAKQLTNGLGQLQQGANQLDEGLKKSHTGANQLAAGLSQVAPGANQLAGGLNQLSPGANQLAQGLDKLTPGANQLAGGLNQMSEKLQAGSNQLPQLKSGANSLADGTKRLSEGANKLADGTNRLTAGAQSLADGNRQLAGGLLRAKEGQNQLTDGANQLANGINQLENGQKQLSEGAGKLSSELADGAQKIPTYSEEKAKETASALANPITTQVKTPSAPERDWHLPLLWMSLLLGLGIPLLSILLRRQAED
ncbi:MMPL family transporter [Actinomycetaceae bacterium TAE3-ERU4]|nr:MMPL family transporter [Actinomycetaceae bacterium TAE3-ERU4]